MDHSACIGYCGYYWRQTRRDTASTVSRKDTRDIPTVVCGEKTRLKSQTISAFVSGLDWGSFALSKTSPLVLIHKFPWLLHHYVLFRMCLVIQSLTCFAAPTYMDYFLCYKQIHLWIRRGGTWQFLLRGMRPRKHLIWRSSGSSMFPFDSYFQTLSNRTRSSVLKVSYLTETVFERDEVSTAGITMGIARTE